MDKIMVTATFQDFNIQNKNNKHASFLVGKRQIFYCGEDEKEAFSIYNNLANDDKEIFNADVEMTTIHGTSIVKKWNKIKNLQLL